MIRHLLLSIIGCMTLQASQLQLTFIHIPVYFHSDADPVLSQIQVPFVTSYASPEARLGAMNLAFIPHHDESWNSKQDINLITVYKFSLAYEQIAGTKDYRLTIDASNAKAPGGYPFTVEEVLDQIKRCAPKNFDEHNGSKLIIDVVEPQQEIQGTQAAPSKR